VEEVEEELVKVTEAHPRCQESEAYSRGACPHLRRREEE